MPETTKLKVLVADDEQIIANTLAIILNRAGFDARAVYSGEKLVEMAQSFEPDVLISDVVISGITGIEAAIEVLAKLPSCKILLFSGQAATVNLLERARVEGQTFEIITKPIHPNELVARLASRKSDVHSHIY
jgi:DNA-binding response OmpR family regulator